MPASPDGAPALLGQRTCSTRLEPDRIASMNEHLMAPTADLAMKIARLVEERGWNQEEFARNADLNRQTVRQILQPSTERRLRNATVGACAKALNLSVHEL